MARAKRTDRTEARRRYRAELAALTPEEESPDEEATPSAAKATVGSKRASVPAQPRPSITAALRTAFRPVDLRGDLRALPRVVTHWGVLAAAVGAVIATAVFIASTNDLASSIDFSVSSPLEGKPIGSVTNFSYLAVSLLVAPPPAAGAFLVGFTAPRASWLGGLAFGIVAAICYAVILASPAGRLLIGANSPDVYVVNALALGPIGALLFASASAWYRRFLNIANPNRGRRPTKPQQGRGNTRANSRAAAGRRP